MHEMKQIDCDWLDTLPSEWAISRLKSVFSFGKGLPITKADLTEQGIPVISYGQIHAKYNTGTNLTESLFRYVDPSFIASHPSSLVHEGDIMIADTSEDLEGCGNCVYVDKEMPLFAGYHTIILRSKNQENNKYLAYLFQTDAWRSQLRKQLTDVKLFSVSQKTLSVLQIIAPPQDESRAIVEFLDVQCTAIDEAIAKHKAIIEKLEQYRSSQITYMATKGDLSASRKQSGNDWYGDIPSNWEVKRFKYIAKVKSNLVEPEPYESFYQIGPDIIEGNTGRIIGERTVKEAGIISGNHLFYKGQILYSKVRPALNKVVTAPYDGLCSADMYPIETSLDSEYMKYLMLSKPFTEQARLIAMIRVKMPKINQEELGDILCVVPPVEEQRLIAKSISKVCNNVQDAIDRHLSLINKLQDYRKSLIYHAVTGKIDCRKEANHAG